MIIGALNKFSAIDYPGGLLACVVGTQGCNLRCGWCHNGHLVTSGKDRSPAVSTSEVFAFLRKRAGQLDGVVITGGEPTLQRDLSEFCRQIKQLGYRVKLDTNGTRPQVLSQLLDQNLVDYVAMDLKTLPRDYGLLSAEPGLGAKITQSISILMDRSPAYEFRTTCVRPFVSQKIILSLGGVIQGAERYILQRCRPEHVLDPHFFSLNQPPHDAMDMETLRNLVAPMVRVCAIR